MGKSTGGAAAEVMEDIYFYASSTPSLSWQKLKTKLHPNGFLLILPQLAQQTEVRHSMDLRMMWKPGYFQSEPLNLLNLPEPCCSVT
jgi:hypothetical protein